MSKLDDYIKGSTQQTTQKPTTQPTQTSGSKLDSYLGITPAKTSEPLIQPTQTSSSGLFSSKDPKVLLNLLYQMIPEATRKEMETKKPAPKNIKEATEQTLGFAGSSIKGAAQFAAGIPKFLLSAITRPVATGSEALGGPKNILGQPSAQEEYKGVQEMGGGKLLSAAYPLISELLAISGVKGLATGLKPKAGELPKTAEIPKPVNTDIPTFMREQPVQPAQTVPIPKGDINIPPGLRQEASIPPLNKIMDRYGKKLQAEASGNQMLDSMAQRKISPQNTATQFWNNTFDQLPKVTQDKMVKLLEDHTGMKLGYKGTTIQDMVKNIDLGNDINNLQGTERGFTTMMQYANDKLQSNPQLDVGLQPAGNKPANLDVPTFLREETGVPVVGKETLRQMLPDEAVNKANPLPWEKENTPQIEPVDAPLPKVEDPIPNVPTSQGGFFSNLVSKFKKTKSDLWREAPLSTQAEKVQSLGPEGEALVNRGRRSIYKEWVRKGQYDRINQTTGISGFTPQESQNLILTLEGKTTPMNPKVQAAVKAYTPMFDQAVKDLGIDSIDMYAPRRLSPEGLAELGKDGPIVQRLAKEMGMEPTEVISMIKEGKRKGFFEYERQLPDWVWDEMPAKYRDFSPQVIYDWQNSAARRFGTVTEFGKDLEIANRLRNEVVEGIPDFPKQEKYLKYVDDYLDAIGGKTNYYSDIPKALAFVRNSMIVSKLNPISTLANEFQGWVNSYMRFGTEGLKGSLKSGGTGLVKELGLENLRGKLGEQLPAESFASKWLKGIGFEGSDLRNVGRSAKGTEAVINSAWDVLKRNPENQVALNQLHKLGMFVDDSVLKESLKSGELPALEKAVGIMEGVRQTQFVPMRGERPQYATTPTGSVAYIFHHYLLEQTKLWAKAPLDRQIAYLGVISPILGIPMMVLRKAITGQAMPKGPLDWYKQATGHGPGTVLDVGESLSTSDRALSYMLGGYYPWAKTGMNVLSGNLPGAGKELFKAATPLGSLLAPRVFPPKQPGRKKANQTIL